MRQQVAFLPDGKRLHLQDGPIDLVIEAFGRDDTRHRAHDAAIVRFETILDELCTELPQLRAPATNSSCRLEGPVARRMQDCVAPFAGDHFATPMAAVAGAVADAILAAMLAAAPDLERAYVNNGGDIALHLASGHEFSVALIDRPDCPARLATATIRAADPVRGIATSGWRGRSFSLGIADAVTVLAASAPEADVAATLIANAIDLPDRPGIVRMPANSLQPDSDLGARPVTRAVPALAPDEIASALARGVAFADSCLARGLIAAASLHIQGATRTIGLPLASPRATAKRMLVHA
jgi:ApbE superfamily uncharacterized protein (UPF0280 family)